MTNSRYPGLSDLHSGSTQQPNGSYRATVAGHAVDWWVPEEGDEGDSPGLILFLHGHDQRSPLDESAWQAEFKRAGLPVVCPHGDRSWWSDRKGGDFDDALSPEEWLKKDVLPWIERHFGIAPPLVCPMGVGMGGQGALRLSYDDAFRFPVVVAISPAIDFSKYYGAGLPMDDLYESREDARQNSVVLRIHPLNWPKHQMLLSNPLDEVWHDGADRLAMKLSSSGIMHDRDFKTAVDGPPWEYFARIANQAVAFAKERLDRVSRSL